MLFTSVRVSPCSARWRGSSLGRTMRSVPSSRSTRISGWRLRSSVPSGPLTVRRDPSCVTSTPLGMLIGMRPMRDMATLPYQTKQSTSPPRFSFRACDPVMIPREVERTTRPSPPRTRGISVLRAYTRSPGLLMRLRPLTTGVRPSTYLRRIERDSCTSPGSVVQDSMKPSSVRTRAISRLTLDEGTVRSLWRAALALRIRVSMSAIGSVVFIVRFVLLGGGSRHAVAWEAPAADGPLPAAAPSVWYRLPAGLGHSRQEAVEGPLPEADAAHPETTHEAARAAADRASVVLLDR